MTDAVNGRQLALNAPGRSFRSPRRITITLPHDVHQRLLDRSDQEGRSLSNLAAFLLESALESSRSAVAPDR